MRISASSMFLIGLAPVLAASAFAAGPGAGPTDDADFNAFLGEVERAENAFTKGDSTAMLGLMSESADATLLGGAGGYVKGIDAIRERMAGVSARYSEGETRPEYLASRIVGDLAYTVSIDHRELRLDGRTINSDLRTTQIFIKQDGRWRLLHRHSDPSVRFQPAA